MTIKNFFILALVFVLFGCSFFQTKEDEIGSKNAEQLASEGTLAFQSQDYDVAKKAYTDLKDWYPFSKYAILAELKIADANFQLEEYDEAIMGYEDFEKMHPKNEAIPYVIYQNAMSWFMQIDSVDRDNTPAKKSLAQFNRLIERFPQSEYAQKALENLKKCQENLSGHELYVANFYMRTKKYKAALERYEYLVKNFPDSKESQVALKKIATAQKLLEQD